jgi:hypothetical protein
VWTENEEFGTVESGTMSVTIPPETLSEEASGCLLDNQMDSDIYYRDRELEHFVENSEDFQLPVIRTRCSVCAELRPVSLYCLGSEPSLSLNSFKASATNGCDMCSTIIAAVGTVVSHVPEISEYRVRLNWVQGNLLIHLEDDSASGWGKVAVNIFSGLGTLGQMLGIGFILNHYPELSCP